MNPQHKINDFLKSCMVLEKADFEAGETDEIYRSGIIAESARTFELAWKGIQAVLEPGEAERTIRGSPRSVLRAGFRSGLISEEEVWLRMLDDRNRVFHTYNTEVAEDLLNSVRNDYYTAFRQLGEKLRKALQTEEQ